MPVCGDQPAEGSPSWGGGRKAPDRCVVPAEPPLRLTGGGCRCAGLLEVKWKGGWNRVCRDEASEAGAAGICQRLGCGLPSTQTLQVGFAVGKELALRCLRMRDDPARCRWEKANCTDHAVLACDGEPGPPPRPPPLPRDRSLRPDPSVLPEPVKTTPEPPPVPPTTSPEPTGKSPVPGSIAGAMKRQTWQLWGLSAQ